MIGIISAATDGRFNRIRQVAPMCPHRRAHCCYLANTIELSVCGCDAALCQIFDYLSLLLDRIARTTYVDVVYCY